MVTREDELRVAFDVGRASSLSPRETFRDSPWSGGESSNDEHADSALAETKHPDGPMARGDVVDVKGVVEAGAGVSAAMAKPADEAVEEVKSAVNHVDADKGLDCRPLGVDGTRDAKAMVKARRRSVYTRRCSTLPDETKLPEEEGPGSARVPASPIPTPRRSSRIAAANMKAATNVASASRGTGDGVDGISSARGARFTRSASRGKVARSPTPPLASRSKGGGMEDDPNTSFRTAIMGDASPRNGSPLIIKGDTRRGALFADDDSATAVRGSEVSGGMPALHGETDGNFHPAGSGAGRRVAERANGSSVERLAAAMEVKEASGSMTSVEREGAALAMALIKEEEARERAKAVGGSVGAGEPPTTRVSVMMNSPPEGDAPSVSVSLDTQGAAVRGNTPPEMAVERPNVTAQSGAVTGAGSSSSRTAASNGAMVAKPANSVSSQAGVGVGKACSSGSVAISTVMARGRRVGGRGVASGRAAVNGPVMVRRQPQGVVQQQAVARGRSTTARGSVASGGVEDRTGVRSSETAQAAAPVVPPVSEGSSFLAPTASTRARSVSPTVTTARGRAPNSSSDPAVRSSSVGPRRSDSTGRRAVTMPKTPNFRTTARAQVAASKPYESTEDREMRLCQEKKEELKQMTRRNQASMERSLRTSVAGSVRSTKLLTVPESPAMKTAARLGGKAYSSGSVQPELGQDHAKSVTAPHPTSKPTLPVAPRLRTEARAAAHAPLTTKEEREEAELADMRKHQFRARPYRSDGVGMSGEKGVFRPRPSEREPTQPAPFALHTEGRASRRSPSPVRNRDEEELGKQFKARPMPERRSSSVGRIRPGANVSPTLSSDQRVSRFQHQRQPQLQSQQLQSQRPAQPQRQPQQLQPQRSSQPQRQAQSQLTVAASPMLLTKRRSAIRCSAPEAARPEQGAAPGGMPAAPSEKPGQPTEPRPFHLRSEERGRVKQALLAQRLEAQRRQEEAAWKVRARPMPPASTGFVPAPSERPLTETVEFRLAGQARHERAALEFQQRVRQEEEQARRAMEVRALPLPNATYDPEELPPRHEVAPTSPADVRLHSTSRAEDRAHWEKENQARLAAEERDRLQKAEAAAEAEKMAIAELRRRSHADGGMSFKATPVGWNTSPAKCPQLSTVPLTTPITPNLQTKRRAMNAAHRVKANR